MKVLFAVSDENISNKIISTYQQKYKEIITTKNVYYFDAIVNELRRDRTYDAIVISEDLEPMQNSDYERIDKFLFEKLDKITDEASKPSGEDIPIILICSDRRNVSDELLVKLFGIGVYNCLIGKDRSVSMVCELLKKPRTKKEAKMYYKIESDEVNYKSEDNSAVSEEELKNIISYFQKQQNNEKKIVDGFKSVASQYDNNQLRLIVKVLPMQTKAILEAKSPIYQKLMTGGTILSNGKDTRYGVQTTSGIMEKVIGTDAPENNVIIPTAMNTNSSVSQFRPMQYSNPYMQNNNQNMYNNQNINQNTYNGYNNQYNQNRNNGYYGNMQNNPYNQNYRNPYNNNQYGNNMMQNGYNNQNRQNNVNNYNQGQNQYSNPYYRNNSSSNSNVNGNMPNYSNPYNNNMNNSANQNGQNTQNRFNTQNTNNSQYQNNMQEAKSQNIANNINNNFNETKKLDNDIDEVLKKQEEQISENTVSSSNTNTTNNYEDIFGSKPSSIETNNTSNQANKITFEDDIKEEDTDDMFENDLNKLTKSDNNSNLNLNQNSQNEVKEEIQENQEQEKKPKKRGRGRPRKNPLPDPNVPKVPKKRGRPRKNQNKEEEKQENSNNEEQLKLDLDENNKNEKYFDNNHQIQNSLDFLNEDEDDNKSAEELLEDDKANAEILNKTKPEKEEQKEKNLDDYSNIELYNNFNEQANSVTADLSKEKDDEYQFSNDPVYNDLMKDYNNSLKKQEKQENMQYQNNSNNYENQNNRNNMNSNYNNYNGNNNQNNYGNYRQNNNNQLNNNYNMNNGNNYYNNGMNSNNQNGFNTQNNQYSNNQNMNNGFGNNSYNQNNFNNNFNNYNNQQNNNYNMNNQANSFGFTTPNQNCKVVSFVGTSKNGTSFVINNLALLISESNTKVAIIDLTKNKNDYYLFTDNDSKSTKIAEESLIKLSNGDSNSGLEINRNLSLFTSLPGDEIMENYVPSNIIRNVSSKFDIAILDCDFNTDYSYFQMSDEIYLVQSMDAFTIQPLTKFLANLKDRNVLDESKLRIVINKYMKMKRLTENMIIGGMSKYNAPSMTAQKELFDPKKLPNPTVIPFEEEIYEKYLESIATCNLNLAGYPQSFISSLENLKRSVLSIKPNTSDSQNNGQKRGGFWRK